NSTKGVTEKPPDWSSIPNLKVYGTYTALGAAAPPDLARGQEFDKALKDSEVVIVVGHGESLHGETNPFHQDMLQVGDNLYTPQGEYHDISGSLNPPLAGKPDVSASVVRSFTCDSANLTSQYFNFNGQGQMLVTINSGTDGYTAVGTLEKAAYAFAKAYSDTRGTTQERVQAGVRAANKIIRNDQNVRADGKKVNAEDSAQATPVTQP
ncbi:MAG TPA: hypothetical protein VEZ90_05090, partial [Blastocatellia bacterium]|nr:hypothetical protein [Blastocatellia bacterium]